MAEWRYSSTHTQHAGEKEPGIEWIGGGVGPDTVWTRRKGEQDLPGVEPRFLGYLSRSLVAITTVLSRLQIEHGSPGFDSRRFQIFRKQWVWNGVHSAS
jgi:hypothetical protein